ncbi:hypothetical protein ACHAXR_006632 [Thalassiosira sp. AJA248-18]
MTTAAPALPPTKRLVAMTSRKRNTIEATCVILLAALLPVTSFLTPPLCQHRHAIIINHQPHSTTVMMAGVADLLYQEQEKIIVRRGELEEQFITNAKPLEAPVIKVRGTGKAGGFGKSSGGGGGGSKASSKAEGKAHAKVLKREGVVRIDNVISPDTADAVREHLYNLRYQSEQEVKEGKIQPIQRFADVLLKQNRCDLTIPLGNEIITKALEESLRKSPVGVTISAIFGDDAILHEFSCLMSDPGSQRQNIHPDTPCHEGKGPVLYTCFIALQDVTLDMGPTTWLPRTHNKEAHDAFKDSMASEGGGDSPKDNLIKTQPAVLGTLTKGSCGIFDSRLLHCGTANRSKDDISRALFYFSFKSPEVGYPGNPASIRQELGNAKVSLGALMDDLDLYGKGKGSPLIDKLGSQMRSFLTPQCQHHHAIIINHQPHPDIATTVLMASDDASSLLQEYQEQESIIVKRGELEEQFITNAKPLEAPAIKVRGTGKAGGFGKSSGGGGGNKASSKAEGKAHAKVLKREGVVRIDNVISPDTADAVKEYLYNLRYQSEQEVKEGKIQPIQRFATVLLKQNRCDLTIPLVSKIITKALEESLRKSPVGVTISAIFGDDAILHEFSCLMSDPGSQRQNIHPDTPCHEGKGPVLYTCFIALQDVTLDMGPTTWLPRTHNKEAHDAFKDSMASEGGGDSPKDNLIKTQPAVLGTLTKGSCGIFDSRLLHCGTANRSKDDISRALFYFSFKSPEVGYPGNPASIRQELGNAKVSLGALMEDLKLFGKGKGSPLIDKLGSQMR